MLIDDNEIDNLINQKMIESSGIAGDIYVHTSAKSALEFLRNIEKTPIAIQVLPNIIFLDLDMPLMDGFQFLGEFAKLSDETKATSKIVMLTSSINPQDLNQSKKFPAVKLYLNKPLSQEALMAIDI